MNIDNLKLDENKKTLLIFIIALILILIMDFLFLMKPQLNLLNRINPKLVNMTADIKSANFDIQQKPNFEKRYESAKAKISLLEKRIPKDEEISLILDEISIIAKENHVKITQIKPLKENEEVVLTTDIGTYYKLPIYIDAFCGYHPLGEFLNKIEYSDIFMKVVEIEMVENKNDPRTHQVRLIINTFVIEKK